MELMTERRKQVHSCQRLPLEQMGDVITRYLQAGGFLDRNGAGLVRRLRQHRSEAEERACYRLVDDHFLMVLVHRGDSDLPRDHHIGLAAWIADFVDAFARGEYPQIDLAGQHRSLIVVQQGKERNSLEQFWFAR